MSAYLLVAVGGAVGACLRHGISAASLRWIGPGFPWGTLAANLVGSFFMGILVGWLAISIDGGRDLRLLVGTGMLGGFTTFSAFSLETVLMIERKSYGIAILYAAGSVIAGVLLVFLGLFLARRVFA